MASAHRMSSDVMGQRNEFGKPSSKSSIEASCDAKFVDIASDKLAAIAASRVFCSSSAMSGSVSIGAGWGCSWGLGRDRLRAPSRGIAATETPRSGLILVSRSEIHK